MPRKRAWSPLRGFEGGGWYVGDPWKVTNRSNARYPV